MGRATHESETVAYGSFCDRSSSAVLDGDLGLTVNDAAIEVSFCTELSFLRPVTPDDIPFLYDAETMSLGPDWRLRGQTPSMERYSQDLFAGVHSQYLVSSTATGEVHGLVRCTNPDLVNGHAQLSAGRFNNVGIDRIFAQGFCRFVTLIFDNWPFWKLYLEVAGYNMSKQAAGLQRFSVLEATIPGYFAKGSERFDKNIFAIQREPWFEGRWSKYGANLS